MHGRSRALGVLAGIVATLGIAAPAAQADTNLGTVAGLTYMRDDVTTAAPAPSVLAADAACPAGTKVVGGGATSLSTSNIRIQFWLHTSGAFDGPDPDRVRDDGWIGRGYNRFGEDKAFQVYAICSAATVRYATNRASAPAGSGVGARAACPSGTHVAGGSAQLSRPATQAYLNTSAPYDGDDADSRPDDGWKARAYNQGGSTKTLTVQAQCVAPLPRYVSQASASSFELATPGCPAGTHVMGGGGEILSPASRAFLNAVYPRATGSGPPDDQFVVAVSRTDPSTYVGSAVCKA